jgi:UDP-glucose 4-epimerase
MTLPIALVTGAHGFIGRHLSRRLATAGFTVIGVGHGAWPTADAAACGVSSWLNGDISPSNLHTLSKGHGRPDFIFHLAGGSSVGAAVASPREDFFRTVATTAELLEWMRQEAPQARLVAVSSAAVYGAGHDGPIDEQAPLTPYSPYGYHKMMMESLCRSYASTFGIQVVVARLFSVYGAGLRKQLLWDLCSKLEADSRDPVELGGTGQEVRDWTDVRDVARALTRVADLACPSVPTLNIGSGHGTTVSQVVRLVLDAWSEQGSSVRAIVFNGRSRAGDPFSLQAQSSTLASLGFEWGVDVGEGLAQYVRWFRQRMRGEA